MNIPQELRPPEELRRPGILVGLGISLGAFAALCLAMLVKPTNLLWWLGCVLFCAGEVGAIACVGRGRGRLAAGVALGAVLGAALMVFVVLATARTL